MCLNKRIIKPSYELVHYRPGHVGKHVLGTILEQSSKYNLSSFAKVKVEKIYCICCKEGKMTRDKVAQESKTLVHRPTAPAEKLHLDTMNPFSPVEVKRESFALLVSDDISLFRWVFPV